MSNSNIVIEIDGIDGDCTASGFEGAINLASIGYGVARPSVTSGVGTKNDRESSLAQFTSISVSKQLDKASVGLFEAATVGGGKDMKVHFLTTGDKPKAFLTYTLTNAIVSGYRFDAHGTDRPREDVELSFDTIEKSFISQGNDGADGDSLVSGYDLTTGTKL